MHDLTGRLARASSRHPRRTLAAWGVVLVLSVVAIGGLLGSTLTTDAEMTNDPESYRAYDLIGEHFPPSDDYVQDVVVIRSPTLRVTEPAFRAKVEALAREIEATGAVQPVPTVYSTGDRTLVAPSGRATILPLGFLGPGEDRIGEVIAIVDRAETDGFETAITGELTADEDFSTLAEEDLQQGELQFGLPVALLVLLLVFGAVVAGLLPVLVALVAIIVALGLTALLGQAFDLSVFVVNMISGMGLALGIDYSLFVVFRYREERRRGNEKLDAIGVVGSTACRAVLFSGSAFVLAMVGMVLVPDTILRSLAAGAVLVGIVTVVAALTLLPAVLALLGDRVNALRVPWLGRRVEESAGVEGRVWSRIVRAVMRAPLLAAAASAGALLLAGAARARDRDGAHGRAGHARPVRGQAGLHAPRGRVRRRDGRLGRGRRRGRRAVAPGARRDRRGRAPARVRPGLPDAGGLDERGRAPRGRRGARRGRQPRQALARGRGEAAHRRRPRGDRACGRAKAS